MAAILMANVDFNEAANPSLRRVTYPIPQFFLSRGLPLDVENAYLRSIARRIRHKSIKTVAEHLREFTVWRIDMKKELWDLSNDDLDYFIDAQCSYVRPNGKRLAWNTVNSRAGTVHRFLMWCQLNGHCQDIVLETMPNVGAGTKIKYKVKGHPSRKLEEPVRFLMMDKAIALIQAIEELSSAKRPEAVRNGLIAKLMLQCGLRISEAVSFPLRDLPEIRPEGHSTPARIVGKGDKPRVVLIPNRLLADLWEYRDLTRQSILERLTDKASRDVSSSEGLFISQKGEKISANWVEKIFAKVGSRIKVKAVPHALRHTFGTYHYLHNKDLLLLSKLMGHSSVETTEKFYVHIAKLVSHTSDYEEFQAEVDRKCLEART